MIMPITGSPNKAAAANRMKLWMFAVDVCYECLLWMFGVGGCAAKKMKLQMSDM